MRRKLLGKASGAVSRQRVYRIADGLEVDDIDHYEVSRRRVYFDEVTAVTYHAQRGWIAALVLGVPALSLLTIAAVFVFSDEITTALIFSGIGVLLAIPALLRISVPAHVVTVFGKRTKAVMRFNFRRERARRVFRELVTEVHTRQDALRNDDRKEGKI